MGYDKSTVRQRGEAEPQILAFRDRIGEMLLRCSSACSVFAERDFQGRSPGSSSALWGLANVARSSPDKFATHEEH